jgi:hypothetical protein
MAARGVEVSHETVRERCDRFGAAYAKENRRRRPRPGDKWPLDEIVVKMNGPCCVVQGWGRRKLLMVPGPSDAESQFSERGYHAIRDRALGREFVVRGLNGTAPCGSSRPAARSCRTCDGATTNSPSTYPHKTQLPPPSAN